MLNSLLFMLFIKPQTHTPPTLLALNAFPSNITKHQKENNIEKKNLSQKRLPPGGPIRPSEWFGYAALIQFSTFFFGYASVATFFR